MTKQARSKAAASMMVVAAALLVTVGCGGSGGGSGDLSDDEAFEFAAEDIFIRNFYNDGFREVLQVVVSDSATNTFQSRNWANSACPRSGTASGTTIGGASDGEGAFTVSVSLNECRAGSGAIAREISFGTVTWNGDGAGRDAGFFMAGTVTANLTIDWRDERMDGVPGNCTAIGSFAADETGDEELVVVLTCGQFELECSTDETGAGGCVEF